MKKLTHEIVPIINRGGEYGTLLFAFKRAYNSRDFDEAEKLLEKLFYSAAEAHPLDLPYLVGMEAALKAEKGELMKAIRLNRDLLEYIREGELTVLERIASANLIKDLEIMGYTTGALQERKAMSRREVSYFISRQQY